MSNKNKSDSGGIFKLASRYYTNSKRLMLKSTRKPTNKELKITSRIVALGILVIGLVGFLIDLILKVALAAIGAE